MSVAELEPAERPTLLADRRLPAVAEARRRDERGWACGLSDDATRGSFERCAEIVPDLIVELL